MLAMCHVYSPGLVRLAYRKEHPLCDVNGALVLPCAHDNPPSSHEQSVGLLVALSIPGDLRSPIVRVVFGSR